MQPQHDKEIARRLLLAKDFFARASNYMDRRSGIDRIVAIHHFHVAIEITVKAILTHYEIRSDKTLNIDFEAMLSEVDRYEGFVKANKTLRYRQDLRNLNQARNLAQHHAVEPEPVALEHWRKVCERFLEDAFDRYFDVKFWELSRISYIQDGTISKSLFCARYLIDKGEVDKSIYPIGIAFDLASRCLSDFLPDEGMTSSFFVRSRLRRLEESEDLNEVVRHIYDRIYVSDHFIGIIGSGVSLRDLKKFRSIAPKPTFTRGGTPRFVIRQGRSIDRADVLWAEGFVIDTALLWQDLGMHPTIDDRSKDGVSQYLKENVDYEEL